jgi:hypothetical protein
MPTGLLARPWKAGVLDTTGAAGPIWRVPGKLSSWAAGRLVLGGLCRIGRVRPNRRSVVPTVADETYLDDDLLAGEALSTQRLDYSNRRRRSLVEPT